jgi:hypothetical protein
MKSYVLLLILYVFSILNPFVYTISCKMPIVCLFKFETLNNI